MNVKAILEDKGRAVETIGPDAALAEAIRLAERRIGAPVVTNDDRKVVGILSERDIVRRANGIYIPKLYRVTSGSGPVADMVGSRSEGTPAQYHGETQSRFVGRSGVDRQAIGTC